MNPQQKFKEEAGLDHICDRPEYIKWMEAELRFREENKEEILKAEMDIAKVMDIEHPDNFMA
jgi:hypothetical protein